MKNLTSKIEGITYRMWQSDEDYETYVSMRNAYNKKVGIDRVFTAKDIKTWLEAKTGFKPENNFFIAEHNGEAVTIQNYYQTKESGGPHIFFHNAGFHPDWLDHPVAGELFEIVESKYRDDAKELPNAVARCGYQDKEEWLRDLLLDKGFEEIRYFFKMIRPIDSPIPERELPENLVFAAVDTKDKEWQVLRANDKGFEDHWEHIPMTDEQFEAWMQDSDYNPKLWTVVWDGDEVAASMLNFIDKAENEAFDRKRGYTEEITTQRPYRGKGVASAMIARSIRMFKEMGMTETCLSVDTVNPSGALGLYESFGYKTYKRMVAMGKKIK